MFLPVNEKEWNAWYRFGYSMIDLFLCTFVCCMCVYCFKQQTSILMDKPLTHERTRSLLYTPLFISLDHLFFFFFFSQKLPDASITADVIVGFPGETEEQFQETLQLMEQVVFDSVNTAAYSPRPNTPAADWENQLSEEVKQDRLARINRLNLVHAAERRHRMLGRTVQVLVEERNVKVPTQVMGRTTHGYIVYCDGDIDKLRGELVHVRIDTAQTYYLAGKRVLVE